MSVQATILAVVAADAESLIRRVAADAANVSAILERPAAPAEPERVRNVWRAVAGRPPVYALVGFDPLEALVDAWSRRLGGVGNDLELAIGLTAGLPMPDYYLVDEALEEPERQWYFELVLGRAPARVVPFDGSTAGIKSCLRTLPAGRSLPAARELTEAARAFVPGTTGLSTAGPSSDPGIQRRDQGFGGGGGGGVTGICSGGNVSM